MLFDVLRGGTSVVSLQEAFERKGVSRIEDRRPTVTRSLAMESTILVTLGLANAMTFTEGKSFSVFIQLYLFHDYYLKNQGK